MGVECASCGQVIPPGQFRCGSCGAVQNQESFDDYGGMTEVPSEAETTAQPSATAEPTANVVVRAPAAQAPVAPAPSSTPSGEDDEAAREPLVPRGTFASEVPDRAAGGDERENVRVEVVARPAPKPAPLAAPAPPPTSAPRIKSVRPAPKPPYLASEILREDLTPSEPGWRLMSLTVQLAPALGALAVLISGVSRTATWGALIAFTALFGMARLELSYASRALLVGVTGGISLAAVTLWRAALGGDITGPLLATVITLLPAALLFRAWFRAAYAARVLVAVALVLAATWAGATGDRELLSLEFEWQSWLPALSWYLFGLLCLLALLAFMGDETTGGCDAWALGLLVWYGIFACARFALESANGDGHPNLQTLGLAEPALAAPTAVALAQIFARALGSRPPRAG